MPQERAVVGRASDVGWLRIHAQGASQKHHAHGGEDPGQHCQDGHGSQGADQGRATDHSGDEQEGSPARPLVLSPCRTRTSRNR